MDKLMQQKLADDAEYSLKFKQQVFGLGQQVLNSPQREKCWPAEHDFNAFNTSHSPSNALLFCRKCGEIRELSLAQIEKASK